MTTEIADKTLETVLVNIIDKVTSGVDKAIEFGAEQLPDIVQQLILFNTVAYLFFVILSPIVIWASIRSVKFVYSKTQPEYGGNPTRALSVFGCIVVVLIFTIALINNTYNLLKITLAPKIWLIEYAAGLVK